MKGNIIFRFIMPLCFILLTLSPVNVMAHTDNSEGYSNFKTKDQKVIAEIYLDYFELGRLIELGVGPGAEKERLRLALDQKQNEIGKYLSSHLEVYMDGIAVKGDIASTDVKEKTGRDYAKIIMEFDKPSDISELQVHYNVFFDDNDPMHRNISDYEFGNEKGQFVFTGDERELQIGNETLAGQMFRFIQLGFHHIMIGYDHLLFVLALIIGTRSVSGILKVISLFTLAHSITLGVTAFDLVEFPAGIIEPLIALSIAFVAVEHLLGFSTKYRYTIVFGFGLIHGIGFAGALQLANDVTWQSLFSILSFNIGIELGQLLVILALMPLLLFIRRFTWSQMVHNAAMTVIFGIGLVWYFERFIS